MKRVWKNKTDFPNRIIDSCLELYDFPKIISDKNNSYMLSKINMLRYVCNMEEEGTALCIRNILINCLHNAHNRYPGSEIWIPKLLVSDFKIKSHFRISSKSAMLNTLKIMHNPRAKNIFREAIELLGSAGKISVENHKTNVDAIEVRTGYKIKLSHDANFIKMIGKTNFYLDNAQVLVIEGAPASVSEINKILEKVHKEKTTMIMIARSFPEEVSATLATNWLKKTLSIIPMVYGNKLENINSHADILAISSGVPISKELGDTLNVDIDEKIGNIFNVHILNDGITCHASTNINNHINALRSKIKEFRPGEEDKNILYHERISGLTNNLLSIKLRQTKDSFLINEELNIAISYYNNMCYMNSKITIGDRDFIVPKNTIDCAIEFRNSFIESVDSIGGFLIKA